MTPEEAEPLTPEEERRFWSKVDTSGECWIWHGGASGRGYGLMRFGGRQSQATHVALFIATGERVPDGAFVLHSCDNPPCVRPDHLRVGTHLENVADMHRRGRARVTRGSANSHARLDEDGVRTIRELLANGRTTREVAVEYGIAPRTVRCIRTGERWGHV